MRKLSIVAATLLTLGAAASAHAQGPTPNTGQRPLEFETRQDSLRDKDTVRRDERVIAITKREFNEMEKAARGSRPGSTFKAQVVVTNHSPKTIKSVFWSASLTDPGTGKLIRTYDVTTDARIAPGMSKKLSKKLPIPRANVVSATAPTAPPVADLKATVTRVTYEDGTASETP
ncbi:MAG: hypothetical protein H7Z38_03145 [Rubrivivax sp.]|nr:hypothetical protein [Pyrinomonadaceae bacterium]